MYTKIFTNWPIGLGYRKWSSDLMLETVHCWLRPFSNIEYSPGMKKCHSWGTPLFIGLVLVQVNYIHFILKLVNKFYGNI